MRFWVIVIFFGISVYSFADAGETIVECEEGIIYCPIPTSPLTTELKPGKVTLKYTVERNGTVKNVELLSSDKYGMWNKSAILSLSQWKYEPSSKIRNLVKTFTFELGS